MNYLNLLLEHLCRWATLVMFCLSLWSITFDTVGFAMYFMLVAIFLHLQFVYYEKKE